MKQPLPVAWRRRGARVERPIWDPLQHQSATGAQKADQLTTVNLVYNIK